MENGVVIGNSTVTWVESTFRGLAHYCMTCGVYYSSGEKLMKAVNGKAMLHCLKCMKNAGLSPVSLRVCMNCWNKKQTFIDGDGSSWTDWIPLASGSAFWSAQTQKRVTWKVNHNDVHDLGCGKDEESGSATLVNFPQ